MTQMNQAMAALKLSLAEMRARDDRLKAMIRQFETQLKRIPRQAMSTSPWALWQKSRSVFAIPKLSAATSSTSWSRHVWNWRPSYWYGRAPLNLALGSMAEIEERLRHSQTQRRHLLNIMEQARMELEALVLVQRIESARDKLAQLKKQISGDMDEDTQDQIIRLEGYIAQYSKQAERAITTGYSRQGA